MLVFAAFPWWERPSGINQASVCPSVQRRSAAELLVALMMCNRFLCKLLHLNTQNLDYESLKAESA